MGLSEKLDDTKLIKVNTIIGELKAERCEKERILKMVKGRMNTLAEASVAVEKAVSQVNTTSSIANIKAGVQKRDERIKKLEDELANVRDAASVKSAVLQGALTEIKGKFNESQEDLKHLQDSMNQWEKGTKSRDQQIIDLQNEVKVAREDSAGLSKAGPESNEKMRNHYECELRRLLTSREKVYIHRYQSEYTQKLIADIAIAKKNLEQEVNQKVLKLNGQIAELGEKNKELKLIANKAQANGMEYKTLIAEHNKINQELVENYNNQLWAWGATRNHIEELGNQCRTKELELTKERRDSTILGACFEDSLKQQKILQHSLAIAKNHIRVKDDIITELKEAIEDQNEFMVGLEEDCHVKKEVVEELKMELKTKNTTITDLDALITDLKKELDERMRTMSSLFAYSNLNIKDLNKELKRSPMEWLESFDLCNRGGDDSIMDEEMVDADEVEWGALDKDDFGEFDSQYSGDIVFNKLVEGLTESVESNTVQGEWDTQTPTV
jgi:chromosome segregation ATPase